MGYRILQGGVKVSCSGRVRADRAVVVTIAPTRLDPYFQVTSDDLMFHFMLVFNFNVIFFYYYKCH